MGSSPTSSCGIRASPGRRDSPARAFFAPETGERIEVELFVAVLGASNYTYAEATRTQTVADWVMSHVRALEYFGGAPCAIVPDQLRSAVTRPCRYEPGVQRTYDELGRHYDAVIFPARPLHPRDKAKVEVGVQVAQRWSWRGCAIRRSSRSRRSTSASPTCSRS